MRPNWYSTTRRIPRVHDDRHPYFCPTNASETASTASGWECVDFEKSSSEAESGRRKRIWLNAVDGSERAHNPKVTSGSALAQRGSSKVLPSALLHGGDRRVR
jgi:hypothetical protein